MCATCVAQGLPYVAGAVVLLRVQAGRGQRRRLAAAAASPGTGPQEPAPNTRCSSSGTG